MDLVSIVVPIYNSSKYLDRCISSLINQTYRNIEIVLVNDGSTDNSEEICLSFKDSRIQYFAKTNSGLSDTRNYGIARATGKYICFVDSDDCINRQFVSILKKLIDDYSCGISMCIFKTFSSDYPNTEIKTKSITKYFTEKDLTYLFSSTYYPNITICCNKMYLKSLFDVVSFPAGKLHEDEGTTYKLIYKSKGIVISNLELYYYFHNPFGITKSKFSSKRLDYLDLLYERLIFCNNCSDNEFARLTIRRAFYYMVSMYSKKPTSILDYEVFSNRLKNSFELFKPHYLSSLARFEVRAFTRLSCIFGKRIFKALNLMINCALSFKRHFKKAYDK